MFFLKKKHIMGQCSASVVTHSQASNCDTDLKDWHTFLTEHSHLTLQASLKYEQHRFHRFPIVHFEPVVIQEENCTVEVTIQALDFDTRDYAYYAHYTHLLNVHPIGQFMSVQQYVTLFTPQKADQIKIWTRTDQGFDRPKIKTWKDPVGMYYLLHWSKAFQQWRNPKI